MTNPTYDVVAIGNAVVDIIGQADDQFLIDEGMTKGSMKLVFSPEEADAIYAKMGPGKEISGGSAANTIAGIAALGGKCGFIAQIADDQLGKVFAHDITSAGIDFNTPARSGDPATGRVLIFVTPDGQRTMNTFLGASQYLPTEALDAEMIRAAKILYLEGYLWDPEQPRAAMKEAIRIAHEAGRWVAFTLSDIFCIERHGEDFRRMVADGTIDILFANENELKALWQTDDLEEAIDKTTPQVGVVVVTRSEQGALALYNGARFEITAQPVDAVVDTTGAGDLFAAGVLHALAKGIALDHALLQGAICAAEVISHYGARPEADLKALVAAKIAG